MVLDNWVKPQRTVSRFLETCAAGAELPYTPELTRHSFWRGLAIGADRSGADFEDLRPQGGWRHNGTAQASIGEAGRIEADAALTALWRNEKSNVSKS